MYGVRFSTVAGLRRLQDSSGDSHLVCIPKCSASCKPCRQGIALVALLPASLGADVSTKAPGVFRGFARPSDRESSRSLLLVTIRPSRSAGRAGGPLGATRRRSGRRSPAGSGGSAPSARCPRRGPRQPDPGSRRSRPPRRGRRCRPRSCCRCRTGGGRPGRMDYGIVFVRHVITLRFLVHQGRMIQVFRRVVEPPPWVAEGKLRIRKQDV